MEKYWPLLQHVHRFHCSVIFSRVFVVLRRMFLRDSRLGTMTSHSLTVVQLCSVIFILLLRLAGEPCPNADLHALWNSDPHYLDELISIWVQAITAGSDSPAALVQHTILSTDWWPYGTFILMTYHDVLKRLWNRRVQSRSLPESVCAALLTLSGWILCCICNCFFRGMLYSGSPFIGVKMSGFSRWECQAACHTFPWRERQCPVRDRCCLRSPGHISPNTETIFFPCVLKILKVLPSQKLWTTLWQPKRWSWYQCGVRSMCQTKKPFQTCH